MPDQEMAVKEELRVTRELNVRQADMTEFDLAKIRKDSDALEKLQERAEDVSVLPTLEREDIPPRVKSIPETVMTKPVPAVCYQQPTAGIFYFSVCSRKRQPSAKTNSPGPIFLSCLCKNRDYPP